MGHASSNRYRCAVLALALALCALVVWLVGDVRPERDAAVAAPSRLNAPIEALQVAPPSSEPTRRPPADGEAEASDGQESPSEQHAPPGEGGLTGRLFDSAGRPIARGRVSVARGPGTFAEGEDGASRYADDDGYFRFDRLSEGDWEVAYLGARRNASTGRGLHLGTVRVVAGRVTSADFALPGERRLRGAFTVEGEQNLALQVQLDRDLPPRRLAAEVWVDSGAEPGEEPAAEDPEGRAHELPVPGAFDFEGLAPGRYVLRVVIATSTADGSEVSIEREVDLFDGDVERAPEVLTWEEALGGSRVR